MSEQTIPLVDLAAQHAALGDALRETLDAVIASNAYIKGPFAASFEAAFAELHGVPAEQVVGCSNGTAALFLALHVAGIGAGDEVIVPANTFIATAEAVCHVGAVPVFVDADADTYGISVGAAERAITPRTRAIIPVHLYGHPANLEGVLALAERHGLVVIEDCAQAHLAEYAGQRVGTFGDFAAFSFYPGKNLGAMGDAGAVLCRRPDDARRLRQLADHGRTQKYLHELVGYNLRMAGLQAAVLSVKLPHLQDWNARRRAHAARYDARMDALGIKRQRPDAKALPVYHLYVVEVERRDAVLERLQAQGIQAGIHYPIPLHQQPAFEGQRDQPACPVAERSAPRLLSLPMFPELTEAQIDRICDAVRDAI